jgi:hypothetical protein
MSKFIDFVCEQLVKTSHTIEIVNDSIHVKANGQVYSEAIFDPAVAFTENEIQQLISISNDVINEKKIQLVDFPILKCWYLITHEKYFNKLIVFDKYDRIGQENLKKEFLEILKIPIADVLKVHLNNSLGITIQNQPSIYLTCDFDILNVWDVWIIKDLAREILYTCKKLELKKLYETIGSYLFSRKRLNFNGFLNERMYCFDSRFINIGFFIASPENKKYDGTIDYQNNLVQSYIQNLKQKGVVFGLHTNFDTKDAPESIMNQQNDFESLFHEKTSLNRHHYLRFHFPDYLETLEMGNIEKDFSIYFPESMLFRAGTCSEYYAWNEKESRPYKTKLIPTTIMDGTFSDYLHCNYDEAITLSINKIELTLKYCDSVVLLWHNRSTYQYANIQNNYHPKLITALIEYLKKVY